MWDLWASVVLCPVSCREIFNILVLHFKQIPRYFSCVGEYCNDILPEMFYGLPNFT